MEIEQLKSQINGFLKANQLQHFTAQNMADGLRMNSASQYQQVVNALNALVHDGDALDDNGQYKHSNHAGHTMGTIGRMIRALAL